MTQKSVLLAVFLLALPAFLTFAQNAPPLKTDRDVQALCEQALAGIQAGAFVQGIAVLRPYATSISTEDVDSLEKQLGEQAPTIRKNYGDAIGFLFISKETLANTVLKLVYLVKYERHIIRWTFIFYKPVDSWVLDYFNYDDSIEALFGPKNPPASK